MPTAGGHPRRNKARDKPPELFWCWGEARTQGTEGVGEGAVGLVTQHCGKAGTERCWAEHRAAQSQAWGRDGPFPYPSHHPPLSFWGEIEIEGKVH